MGKWIITVSNIAYKTFGNQWDIEYLVRIKSTCNLTGKCFEVPNVSCMYPLPPA